MKSGCSRKQRLLVGENLRFVKKFISPTLAPVLREQLRELTCNLSLSLKCGDLLLLSGGWYVTHTGLIRLAKRCRCSGMQVQPVRQLSDQTIRRYAFRERDTRFVELGRYLCEVRAGQYWRVGNVKSFDEFLERRFPESRRKAYYLMSIHENLPPQARRELKEVGWTKGLELAKVARRDRQHFDCATWLHKARELPKQQCKQEVEKELTGKESEPSEIVYFKLYKSQIPVVEQAIETAGLMLGTDKSRGYCLEMICADFVAGANLENGNSQALLQSILRFFKFLPGEERKTFLEHFSGKAS
jgi:hypothetical protein